MKNTLFIKDVVLKKNVALATMFVGLFVNMGAFGASFQLRENNAALVGQAMAGSAAISGDLATMFNNPASMTSLNKHAVALSVVTIIPSFRFKPESATRPTYGAVPVGANIIGNNGGNAGSLAALPAFYLMWNVSDRWKIGMNVTTPFGLKTEYDRDWVGRYYAIKSEVKTYNINPSIAYKVNDIVSVGVGLQVQYIDATLSNAIAPHPLLGGRDAYAEVTGNKWGLGGNVGILVEPKKGTRLGLSYRSHIRYDIRGNITVESRSNLGALGPSLPREGGRAETTLTLPETITLSVAQDLTPQWTVLADLQWTRWSRLKELRIRFPEGAANGNKAADKVQHFGYRDSWFVAIGANYTYNHKWKFKCGIAFDSTPTRDAHRDPRIPDENRLWFAGGLEYMTTENLKFSLDYAFIHFTGARINLRGPAEPGTIDTVGTLRGRVDAYSHLLGARLQWKF
jgi:long-chain fatty acid transport protein